MEVTHIFHRRLLAAFEQAASAGLPPAWRALAPGPGKRRAAAAVVFRLAELPTRRAMTEHLGEMARSVDRSGRDREGKETELWTGLAELLEDVAATRGEGEGNLFTLEVWAGLASRLGVDALYRPYRAWVPRDPPITEEMLTEVARVLLREKAKEWIRQDQKEEKESEAPAPTGQTVEPSTPGGGA